MLHVAGCVIITDQQILLLHKINPARYELPGGKLENGETAEDAAKREVQEELLCEVQIIKKLNEIEFEEDDQIIHYTRFLAMIKKGQQPRIGEKEKFDDVRFVHIHKLGNMQISPNVAILYNDLMTSIFPTQ